jgi:methionyl-tRNA formyltransferase
MKILFAGTPEFAVPALQALIDSSHEVIGVYTQPDRPSGRGRHLQHSAVKLLALKHQLPIYQPYTLRDSQAQQELINLHADIMIVAAYGLILPKAILDAPQLGCINIHASLLPRWRGAAPIHRAILAGDTDTGITIMQIAESLDTGDMLHKTICPIEATDTLQTLHDKLANMGAISLMTVLDQIKNIQPEIQNNTLATYASKISKSEANLDWQQSAESLHRAIRAFYPAYSYIDNQLVKIWEAEFFIPPSPALRDTLFLDDPSPSPLAGEDVAKRQVGGYGTILQTTTESIDVLTGNGVLSLKKIQLAGGKVLSVREILNSRANLFIPGNRFHAGHH